MQHSERLLYFSFLVEKRPFHRHAHIFFSFGYFLLDTVQLWNGVIEVWEFTQDQEKKGRLWQFSAVLSHFQLYSNFDLNLSLLGAHMAPKRQHSTVGSTHSLTLLPPSRPYLLFLSPPPFAPPSFASTLADFLFFLNNFFSIRNKTSKICSPFFY